MARRERPLRPLPVPGREPPARAPQPPPLEPPRVEPAPPPADAPDPEPQAEAVEAEPEPEPTVVRDGDHGDGRRERRLVRFAIVSLVAVVLAGAFAIVASRDGDSSTATGKKGNAIGPLPGVTLFDYAARAKKALADADGTRAAVISFDRYVTESDVPRAVRGVTIKGLLVAPIGGEPRLVTGPLSGWADKERQAAEDEREGLRGMLDTDDPAFKKQFQDDIARLTRVLEALDPAGPIVFGTLVVGSVDALRELSRVVGVRLVDVGPTEEVPPTRNIRGIRPEERRYANDPSLRPLPPA